MYSAISPLAPKASPTFTGTPKAPTANAGTSTEQIATTAFVSTAVGAVTTSSLGAVPTSEKGVANGVATLDANDLVPTNQLPSFVDDVIEAYARSGQTALSKNWLATGSASGTVIDPEAGKIYVLMADSGTYTANSQFRWGGTAYVKLNDGGVSAISFKRSFILSTQSLKTSVLKALTKVINKFIDLYNKSYLVRGAIAALEGAFRSLWNATRTILGHLADLLLGTFHILEF